VSAVVSYYALHAQASNQPLELTLSFDNLRRDVATSSGNSFAEKAVRV
jgi:hypothetical protein